MTFWRHPRVAARDNAEGVAGGDPSRCQTELHCYRLGRIPAFAGMTEIAIRTN